VGPGAERTASVEAGDVAHDRDEGVLRRVVGVAAVTENPRADRHEARVVTTQQCFESRTIAVLGALDECGVGVGGDTHKVVVVESTAHSSDQGAEEIRISEIVPRKGRSLLQNWLRPASRRNTSTYDAGPDVTPDNVPAWSDEPEAMA